MIRIEQKGGATKFYQDGIEIKGVIRFQLSQTVHEELPTLILYITSLEMEIDAENCEIIDVRRLGE